MCEIQGVYDISSLQDLKNLTFKHKKKGLIAPFLLNVSLDLLFEVIIQP